MTDPAPVIAFAAPARPDQTPHARSLRDPAFASALAQAAAANPEGPDKTRQAAEQLVAVTFIQPILRAARESNNAAPPFAPTAIEKQFGPLMDANLADAMVRASRWPLIDRIERDMRAAGGPPPAEIAQRTTPTHAPAPSLPLETRGTTP